MCLMNIKSPLNKMLGDSIWKNFLAIIVVALVLLILLLFYLRVYTRHNQNIYVPKLEGLQIEEASSILKSKGLNIEITDSIFRKDAVPGAIIEQTPKPNSRVKTGRNIYVSIYSKNPQQISIPELADYSLRQAEALLSSMGFDQLSIEKVPSQYDGLVIAVEYKGRTLQANEKIPAGAPLTLVVGTTQLSDSLNIDNEYIISPHDSVDSGNHTQSPNRVLKENNSTKIDDSFF
ncbi:MAG: hypothetical protein JG772_983 [Dysgonamonadaceae bacterium]|nr:hypothetical protein [Dysgonamonadaceae bacterium]